MGRPSLMPMVSTPMDLAILAIPPTATELATPTVDTTMARGLLMLRPSPTMVLAIPPTAMELAMATLMLLADTTMARGRLMLRPSLRLSLTMVLATVLAIPPTAMELAIPMLTTDTTMARGLL